LGGAALLKKCKNKILSRTSRRSRGLPEKRFQQGPERALAQKKGKTSSAEKTDQHEA